MPALTPLPDETLIATLLDVRRRLDALDRRGTVVPSSALPTNPTTGQRAILTHTTGAWELVWSGTAWIFTGGSDLVAYAAAEVATGVNTYPASPQGPSVTLPAAGTFDVWAEARHRHSHTAILFTAMQVRAGAAGVGAEIAPVVAPSVQLMQGAWVSTNAGLALAAGSIGLGFRAPNGGGIQTHYGWRQIRVRPRTLT